MYGGYPPGLDSPLLYFCTVFALLLGALLTLEWIWRITWAFSENPAPFKSPVTVWRAILLMLLVAAFLRIGPRLWLFMRWPRLQISERLDLAQLSAQAEVTAVIIFSTAWLFALIGEPLINYQLENKSIPLHLWPTRQQLKRPIKIGVGVLAIAFALTFMR